MIRERASAGPGRGGNGSGFRGWLRSRWGKATIAVLALLLILGGYVLYTLRDLPDPGKQDVLANTITVYDRKGREIEQRNPLGQYHKVLTLREMGNYGPKATLAAEDRSFYSEGAINWGATLRAAFVDITSGRVAQGGSTITQQLIKIQLLTPQRSILRKVQEAVLATGLEARYSKDQVLEMYLNRIYYGHNAYGLGAASQTYFSKERQGPDPRPGGLPGRHDPGAGRLRPADPLRPRPAAPALRPPRDGRHPRPELGPGAAGGGRGRQGRAQVQPGRPPVEGAPTSSTT